MKQSAQLLLDKKLGRRAFMATGSCRGCVRCGVELMAEFLLERDAR